MVANFGHMKKFDQAFLGRSSRVSGPGKEKSDLNAK
jgi:hypothetical protein